MSQPIDEASLAELYEVALPSGAAHHRAAAEAERSEALEALGWPEEVRAVLGEVPERTGEIHDEKCFTRHAPCLAGKIRDLLP